MTEAATYWLEQAGNHRHERDEALADNARLRATLQRIRNALHAHNRPDTPLPNAQRIRLRDMADLVLEKYDALTSAEQTGK